MATDPLLATRFDLGSWSVNWTSVNVTQYIPSARDLALAGPRIFIKLGSFLAVPDTVDNIFGTRLGHRIIPESTASTTVSTLTTAAATRVASEAIRVSEYLGKSEEGAAAGLASRFSMESARSLSSVVSYSTSKWALTCILMAIILNRTHIYSSTRRSLSLPWKLRLAIRSIPIVLLSFQALRLLQSIKCQTSPEFPMLRWGNASKSSDLMFIQNGGLLHTLSSTILFSSTDQDACLAVRMIPPQHGDKAAHLPEGEAAPVVLSGSLSLLWPLFKTFSFSQLVETISCSVQGRQVAAETGMTLFEHSLAFAEADAAIGAQLGWGSFGGAPPGSTWSNITSSTDATRIAITRSMIMRRVNTTPEVLLVGFLSAMNHLTSHLLAIFNLQGRLRLVSTGFWGLAFMCVILWSILNFSVDDLSDQSMFRFPTVVMVGFIPHVLVLCGIIVCSAIYGAALVLTALAPPQLTDSVPTNTAQSVERTSDNLVGRLTLAHLNMQANIPLASIKITMHMDFYTALLRTGFSVMTMASEAVYLNESRGVSVKERTWLEEERLREIEAAGTQWLGPSFRPDDNDADLGDGFVDAVGLTTNTQSASLYQQTLSGYAKEMIAKKMTKAKSHDRSLRDGVGATERSGRWIMALEFFLGINRLLLCWWASLILRLLVKIGLRIQPRWLLWLARRPKPNPPDNLVLQGTSDLDPLSLWPLSPDLAISLPMDDDIDVEKEMRNRLRDHQGHWDLSEEEKLGADLYSWWLRGGWWGNHDSSGDFIPSGSDIGEDDTSVVSISLSDDEAFWGTDNDDDNDDISGRRTPTQMSPGYSREPTPLIESLFSVGHLSELLDPKTPEQRLEAQTLAAHLESQTILTRSGFRGLNRRRKAGLLTSTRQRPPDFSPSALSGKLTIDEEAQILEYLIITRRASHNSASSATNSTTWAQGATGMGDGGPQCVVCQSSPRSIIVWPCRCLSLCDDCRVTLAMNNFDKCVCCRRDVVSFSRIFVP